MSRILWVACFSGCIAMLCARGGEPAGSNFFNDVVSNPKATGLLVVAVTASGQAADNGVVKGDILTSCAGDVVFDPKGLAHALEKAQKMKMESVTLLFIRGEKEITQKFTPENLGFKSIPVLKGKPVALRPPSTGAQFNFVTLKDAPVDVWYSLYIGGKKSGFEHDSMKWTGDRLALTSEVAFEKRAGDQGPQHYVVTAATSAEAQPELLESHYEFPPSEFTNDGRIILDEKKNRIWFSKSAWPESADGKTVRNGAETKINAAPGLLADFGLELLCPCLPRKAGSCAHVTVLNIGAGDLAESGALLVAKEEEIEVEGETSKAWRVEYHALGQTLRTIWVAPNGSVLKFSRTFYATPMEGILTNKKRAIGGLLFEIEVKTDN